MTGFFINVFIEVGTAVFNYLVKVLVLTFVLFVLVSISAKIQSIFDKEHNHASKDHQR